MKTFAPPKRKLLELLILVVLAGIFYFFFPDYDALTLFVFGFIWNWSASIDMSSVFENRRYRFSMLKTVLNLQNLFMKPFAKAPEFVRRIAAVFPAGTFWWMVIYFNESIMPWWATFCGSIVYELMQIEIKVIKAAEKGNM